MVSSAVKSTKELTEDEVEDYKEAFSNFDIDGNGSIDEGELGVVMRSLGYSPTNQQLKDMMKKVREHVLLLVLFLLLSWLVLLQRKLKIEL